MESSAKPATKSHVQLFDNDSIRGQNSRPLGFKIPFSHDVGNSPRRRQDGQMKLNRGDTEVVLNVELKKPKYG